MKNKGRGRCGRALFSIISAISERKNFAYMRNIKKMYLCGVKKIDVL